MSKSNSVGVLVYSGSPSEPTIAAGLWTSGCAAAHLELDPCRQECKYLISDVWLRLEDQRGPVLGRGKAATHPQPDLVVTEGHLPMVVEGSLFGAGHRRGS